MSTFEDLNLAPELVEALASEGIETPSAVQAQLIPVLLRGNSVLAAAGPGSGIVVAYGAPLLSRIDPEGDAPRALVLVPSADRMEGVADSLARLASMTGHRVAALDGLYVLPDRAHILVATPEAVRARIASGQLSLEALEAVVVDGAGAMAVADALATVEAVLEGISGEVQRLVVAQPVTEAVEAFADAHLRKAVRVPPGGERDAGSPPRGSLTVMEVSEPRAEAALRATAHLLLEARHVVVFVRSEDAAADLGDFLTMRGYAAGRPGEANRPVWLGVDALETRKVLDELPDQDLVILSVDVPGDLDILDRRHGGGREGVILCLPRELGHLEAMASAAGYGLVRAGLPTPAGTPGAVDELLRQLGDALEELDVPAYRALLEPLFATHGPSAVAAAAVALLRKRPARETPPAAAAQQPTGQPPAFVRLFMSVGTKDGVRPGDIVGAITGEARVESDQIGKIDLRETFCLVEVERTVAASVIQALNGTSIRGRAARVDYHRENRGGGRDERGSRGGGRDDRGGRGGRRDDRSGRSGGSSGHRGRRPPSRGDRSGS